MEIKELINKLRRMKEECDGKEYYILIDFRYVMLTNSNEYRFNVFFLSKAESRQLPGVSVLEYTATELTEKTIDQLKALIVERITLPFENQKGETNETSL